MAEYIRQDFQTRKLGLKESCIRIYPIVCLHIGSDRCDMKFIDEHLRRIKDDPNGRYVYLGDGGECALIGTKGDVYTQLLNPQQQMDVLVEKLEPLRGKGLMGFQGNHGRRVDKATGLSWDKTLCHRLGIPYLGNSGFLNLVVNRSSYDLFFHHGADSGVSHQSKVNKAASFANFVNADAIFTAHSHVCMELQPASLLQCDNNSLKVTTRQRRQYICGSAYDSRGGYADEKGYSPILPSYGVVEFDGRIVDGYAVKGQTFRRFESDGSYELEHQYIFRETK